MWNLLLFHLLNFKNKWALTFEENEKLNFIFIFLCLLQNFEKLKVVDVRDSKHLCMTPDFSGVPNLEQLVLRNCVRLDVVHPSINCLNNLILLDMEGCCHLKHFPPNIRCKSLQTLVLSSTALESSLEIGRNMECLTKLYLDRSNITQLHPSIGHLTGLVLLDLSYCFSLSSLPCEIGNLRSLKTLLLKHCTKLDQLPPSLGDVESLETLNITKTSISHAPSSIHYLKNLKTLICEGLSCSLWKSLLPQFNIHQISVQSLSVWGALKLWISVVANLWMRIFRKISITFPR